VVLPVEEEADEDSSLLMAPSLVAAAASDDNAKACPLLLRFLQSQEGTTRDALLVLVVAATGPPLSLPLLWQPPQESPYGRNAKQRCSHKSRKQQPNNTKLACIIIVGLYPIPMDRRQECQSINEHV
jgi:hypothetical protein